MTQLELADLVGLSRASVANIEGGRQSVPLNDVPLYAKALKCRIGDLLPANWRMRQ